MKPDIACVNLEDIALQMTSSLNLSEVLTTITQGLVDELGADFARIWLLNFFNKIEIIFGGTPGALAE